MAKRACRFTRSGHQPCRAPPLKDGDYCRLHSPDHAEEVGEARRLGGLRRRRERTVSAAYDITGLGAVEQIRRVIEIAVLDTLGLETSVARSRTLAYLAQVSLKALEAEELSERVRALEAALTPTPSIKRRTNANKR